MSRSRSTIRRSATDCTRPADLRAGKLAPQDRRQREPDQIIERAPRPVGVDQVHIELARILHRLGHRGIGDGVEGHPLDLGRERLLGAQHLLDVPADRLALAVGVGRQDQRIGLLGLVGDLPSSAWRGRARPATAWRSPRPDRPTRPWAADRGHGQSSPARGAPGPDISRWFSPLRAILRRPISMCCPYAGLYVRARGAERGWRGAASIARRSGSPRLTFPPGMRSSRPARSSSSKHAAGPGRRGAGLAHQFVRGDADGPSRPTIPSRCGSRRLVGRAAEGAGAQRTSDRGRPKRLDHVTRALDEGRAVADQLVAALRPGIERRARDGHDLAARLGRQPRGDQRARARRSLDDDRPRAEPGDDPVAAREVAGPRLECPAGAR